MGRGENYAISITYGLRAPLLANKIDGDCFALVRAHQHGITIHNQDVMTERESGVILFITYYYGGEGEGELGNSKISIVYSIRIGGGGRTEVPLCSLSLLIAAWTV